MRCSEIGPLLSSYLDGELTPAERAKFEAALKEVRALDPGAAYGFTLCWPRTEDL